MDYPELYFPRDVEWYDWLLQNHHEAEGVYLIFYKLELDKPTMRWEEAVKVALCFGWIDSTVKSLGNGKRRQYFCPRNPKSVWSALNKSYIIELEESGLIHENGYRKIEMAKENGMWSFLDDVENLIVPNDLQQAFKNNLVAFDNYKNFANGYQKSYLYWLKQAKREATRKNRINKIILLCENNIKTRQ
ncbi:MAG: YdeI/OmpD-associated family protein [Flavobacteriaceae bacterium]|nr:YdeI/OmpD-associated family protein [Flavobacteriaceae bacterium]